MTQQIEQAKTELQTEIGEQIAKITTLRIDVVEALPTENISKTTIYLIKSENLPVNMQINSVQRTFAADKVVITPLRTNDLSTIAATPDDFYLACFWVNNNWTVVGSTVTDLTPYIKRADLGSIGLSQLNNGLGVLASSEEEAKANSASNPEKFYYTIEEE